MELEADAGWLAIAIFVIFMVHSAKIFYVPKSMLSETNSSVLASIGLFWIISMVCMVEGITRLYRKGKQKSQE